MRKTSILLLFIGLISVLSGCSQAYRSNVYHPHTMQQPSAQANTHVRNHASRQVTQVTPHTTAHKKQIANSIHRVPAKIHHNTQNNTQNNSQGSSQNISQNTPANAIVNRHPARDLMIKIAHTTVGKPYKWGGNTPHQGFDCSGLTSYVHRTALGINIPRTAAEQRDQSRTIDYSQLQPGDMLFFKTGKNANHVGVYIGNRKFVHAATGSKEVKIASMDSAYWHKRFVKFGTFL